MAQQKIRPPTHSSYQEEGTDAPQRSHGHGSHVPGLRVDDDLPDQVRAPDIGALATAGEPDAINASTAGDGPGGTAWPEAPPGATFSPVEAVELRRNQNDPNRLGNPRRNTSAETLLLEYQAALKAYRDDYAGTRSERLRIPFLEAKQRMIDAGLMKGDV
jgi:hypothetical protein